MKKPSNSYFLKHRKIYSLFIISQLFCQNILILNGKTKEPLAEVNVYSSSYGTTTDSSGTCSLFKFKNKESIIISHIGYQIRILEKSQFPKIINLNQTPLSTKKIQVLGIKSKTKRTHYNKLERDVIRVYPYAHMIAHLINEYSTVLDSINNLNYFSKRIKKKNIFRSIEHELIAKYGNNIKKLTKSQGRILIKLVDRQSKKKSFVIIKDFRGLFVAGFWQITARIFGHNLKTDFNPEFGEDKIIEHIIQNIFGK